MNEDSHTSEESSEDEEKDYDMYYMRYKKVEGMGRESRDRRSIGHRQQKIQSKRDRVRDKTLDPHFGIISTAYQRDHNLLTNNTAKNRKDQININQPCPTKTISKFNENNNFWEHNERFINQKIASTQMNYSLIKENKFQINEGNPQNMHISGHSEISQIQQCTRLRMTERQMNRLQIFYHISSSVQRNRTYECQYVHFLLPYALTLLAAHTLSKDTKAYYMRIYSYVLQKLNRLDISAQASSNRVFQECYNYLLAATSAQYDKVLALLSKFLKSEAEIAGRICPYYYNFFAFFANSPILFGGDETVELVQYTIKYQIRYYNIDFTGEDVQSEIKRMEKALAASYKSCQI